MIVFDLQCGHGHRFEGWFGSADEFGAQKSHGLLSCPSCGTDEVARVPSATRFNTGAAEGAAGGAGAANAAVPAKPAATPPAQVFYSKLLEEILKRTEDVGHDFPAEARRIFHDEAPSRAIRGIASPEEHDELIDEGIPVARLPLPDPSGWH